MGMESILVLTRKMSFKQIGNRTMTFLTYENFNFDLRRLLFKHVKKTLNRDAQLYFIWKKFFIFKIFIHFFISNNLFFQDKSTLNLWSHIQTIIMYLKYHMMMSTFLQSAFWGFSRFIFWRMSKRTRNHDHQNVDMRSDFGYLLSFINVKPTRPNGLRRRLFYLASRST